jgi:hypothetical protein
LAITADSDGLNPHIVFFSIKLFSQNSVILILLKMYF